jgi:hypothetical protein
LLHDFFISQKKNDKRKHRDEQTLSPPSTDASQISSPTIGL